MSSTNKELPRRGAFADLVFSLVATPNPQFNVGNEPGEKRILEKSAAGSRPATFPTRPTCPGECTQC